MIKYKIIKISNKEIGSIILPKGIELVKDDKTINIVVHSTIPINYIVEANIQFDINMMLVNYGSTSYGTTMIRLNKNLQLECVSNNEYTNKWIFSDVEETTKEIDSSQSISIGLIESVIL